METFKSAVRAFSRIVGWAAVLAAFFAPFTEAGVWVMISSVMAGLICLWAYTWSKPENTPSVKPDVSN